MSSAASPDAGGDSPIKQSGTAPAVTEPATYPTPASFPGSLIAQLVAGENRHNENEGDGGSLFGDGGPEAVLGGAFTGVPKDHISAREGLVSSSISRDSNINNAAYGNGEPGSGLPTEKLKAVDLPFPTTSPSHDDDNTAVKTSDNGNYSPAPDQTTISTPTNPMEEQKINPISTIEPIEITVKPNASSYDVQPVNASLLASDQENMIGALTNRSVPQSGFSSALLFGPDLQRALFVDGEATSDPQLPASDHPIAQVPFVDAIKPRQTTINMAGKEIIRSNNPQTPPGTPPRLVKLTLAKPRSFPNGAAGSGANPNPLPLPPLTPLTDQLRAEFWEWYHKERDFLQAYQTSYKAWLNFADDNGSETKKRYHETEEELRARVINDQTIWAKFSSSFAEWKVKNPAVAKIIINIHEEMDAAKAAEKFKADRVELLDQLQGKSDHVRRSELARYDGFVELMKQSRDREIWRRRVEVQKDVEAILQAELRARVDKVNESDRAKEELKKSETETTDKGEPATEAVGSPNVHEKEQEQRATVEDPNNWLGDFDLGDPGQNFLS
ncbi:hypothetical protein MMYC01_202121 [Madurella mycetomatis]|uniref:Uncharacterized protein n=1 Tax=Madurella mycetomatis TaxID=100816 RepID=A0A175WAZ1_9PEZI|nr:hypothetical protein MMYC01_202121 [Madurella mycetomatis]